MKTGHGLEQMLPSEQTVQIVRYHMQPEFKKDNLSAGLTDGVESIAQFIHIKANLSPPDVLTNHLFANSQLPLPCLAWIVLIIVAIIALQRFTSRPGPGIRTVSIVTPTVWFLYFQDDAIIRRVSVVCFSLFFVAICRQRLAIVFNTCHVFPMTLTPRNKNAKMRKQEKTSQVREPGRNSLFVVMPIIIVGWCPMFASNEDIALISTIIGLTDHFIGPITIAGIVLLIIVAKFAGNLKLGPGEKSNRKTGSRDAYSRFSSRNFFRGGGDSSGDGDPSDRW